MQWGAIVALGALLLREMALRRRERRDAVADAFMHQDLAEIQVRLTELLADTRRTLAEDLAALEALRTRPVPPEPVAPPSADTPSRPLSGDRQEILRMLADGEDYAHVARQLGRSPHEIRLIERLTGRKA